MTKISLQLVMVMVVVAVMEVTVATTTIRSDGMDGISLNSVPKA